MDLIALHRIGIFLLVLEGWFLARDVHGANNVAQFCHALRVTTFIVVLQREWILCESHGKKRITKTVYTCIFNSPKRIV